MWSRTSDSRRNGRAKVKEWRMQEHGQDEGKFKDESGEKGRLKIVETAGSLPDRSPLAASDCGSCRHKVLLYDRNVLQTRSRVFLYTMMALHSFRV
jgi:hypothetical protein